MEECIREESQRNGAVEGYSRRRANEMEHIVTILASNINELLTKLRRGEERVVAWESWRDARYN